MFNPFVSQPFIESVDALYERTEQRDLLRTFFRVGRPCDHCFR